MLKVKKELFERICELEEDVYFLINDVEKLDERLKKLEKKKNVKVSK